MIGVVGVVSVVAAVAAWDIGTTVGVLTKSVATPFLLSAASYERATSNTSTFITVV